MCPGPSPPFWRKPFWWEFLISPNHRGVDVAAMADIPVVDHLQEQWDELVCTHAALILCDDGADANAQATKNLVEAPSRRDGPCSRRGGCSRLSPREYPDAQRRLANCQPLPRVPIDGRLARHGKYGAGRHTTLAHPVCPDRAPACAAHASAPRRRRRHAQTACTACACSAGPAGPPRPGCHAEGCAPRAAAPETSNHRLEGSKAGRLAAAGGGGATGDDDGW